MRRTYLITLMLGLLSWTAGLNSLQAQIYSLISFTNTWRYNITGLNLGTAWRNTAFNDNIAGWSSGQSLLGFEADTPYPVPFRTPLTPASTNNVVTVYFRTHFNFPTNPAGHNVMLISSNLLDDGAVYYMNGIEVGRTRVPAAQTFQTLATNQAAEGVIEVITLASNQLVLGDNVLAVELHQSATNSSDLAFGMSLTGILDRSGPRLVSAAASTTTNQITVTFDEVLHSSASNVSFYTLTLQNSASTLTVSNAVRAGANVTLTVSPWMTGTNYLLTVNNVRDNTPSTNIIAPNSQIYVTFYSQLFPMEQIWKFYDTTFSMAEPVGNWKTNNYDDMGWASGPALLGKEEEPINICAGAGMTLDMNPNTLLDLFIGVAGQGQYFRTHFTAPSNNGTARFRLRQMIDDGVVYYLNGLEFYRHRMPAGTVTYNTTANGAVGNATCENIEVTVTNLRSGDNVIAAELHQFSDPDNDLLFGLELSAGFTPSLPVGSAPTLNLVRGTGPMINTITLSWTGNGFALESAVSAIGPWIQVANMSNPYSTTLSGAANFYRLKK